MSHPEFLIIRLISPNPARGGRLRENHFTRQKLPCEMIFPWARRLWSETGVQGIRDDSWIVWKPVLKNWDDSRCPTTRESDTLV